MRRFFSVGLVICVVSAVIGVVVPTGASGFGPSGISLPTSFFLNNSPGTTISRFNNAFSTVITLSQSPANPNAGDTVTVSLTTTNGPVSGPLTLQPFTYVVRGLVTLSGAMSGDVELYESSSNQGTICTYPATPIPGTTTQPGYNLSGSYTALGNGPTVLAFKQIFQDDSGNRDGSAPAVCAGTGSNADSYTSDVTQVFGFNQLGVAKTNPQPSATVLNSFTITGPNFSVSSVSSQVSGVTGFVRPGLNADGSPVSISGSGTVWGPSKSSGNFTVQFCDSSGVNCDVASGGNSLSTDVAGNVAGTIEVPAGLTTGNRTIKILEGLNASLTPIVVLAAPSISVSPVTGGVGTVVSIQGSNFNPLIGVSEYETYESGPPFAGSAGIDSVCMGVATAVGTIAGSCAVSGETTVGIVVFQGAAGVPNASNPSAFTSFTINKDRCVAYVGDATGGSGCVTRQNVNVSVSQGTLNQRVYVNTTPTSGSADQSAVSSPVQGTANSNFDPTTINLGTITSPLAPANIVGRLNDITITDTRGGTNGWSLNATASDLVGTPSGSISRFNMRVSATCIAADATNAWDYTNTNKVPINAFDASLNAPGISAGFSNLQLAGVVNLCTKNTQPNATTGSTGGVYNVGGTISLAVPAFQKAARYVSTLTITLA